MNKMSKREIYSWRLSSELKARLDAAAREENASIDVILDRVVREWLVKRSLSEAEDAERQCRLHEQARRAMGTVSVGGPSATNAEVRKVMGEYLEAKHRASQRRAPRRTG
jgi:predicted transcriptional regulator